MPELSYEQKRGLIMNAVDPQKEYKVWIRDVFEDKAIVEDNGRLFEVPYTIADGGTVTLGARKEVITSYVQLAEIPEVEIFEAGTHRGKTWTEDDLDAMVKNFDEHKDKLKPTLVVGHSEEQQILKDSGIPSAGWMDGVKRVGKKLVASFKDVPKLIAELVEKGAYKRISSEIYNNFEDKGYALRRVALLGGDIPEVKTLQDVIALYADTHDTCVVFHENQQSTTEKEKEMPDKDITKLQEDMTKLSEKVTTLESENKALKADKEQAMTRLSEKETGERKAKALGIVKPMRDSGLAPAIAERMEKFAEGLDNSKVEKFGEKEHTLLDEFGSILDSIVKRDAKGRLFVPFGEQAPGASKNEGKGAVDERDEAIKKYQETNKVDYKAAVLAVSKEKPELFKD